jgi:hypothetical protein
MHIRFQSENLNGTDRSRDLVVTGRIIFKILAYDVVEWIYLLHVINQ